MECVHAGWFTRLRAFSYTLKLKQATILHDEALLAQSLHNCWCSGQRSGCLEIVFMWPTGRDIGLFQRTTGSIRNGVMHLRDWLPWDSSHWFNFDYRYGQTDAVIMNVKPDILKLPHMRHLFTTTINEHMYSWLTTL